MDPTPVPRRRNVGPRVGALAGLWVDRNPERLAGITRKVLPIPKQRQDWLRMSKAQGYFLSRRDPTSYTEKMHRRKHDEASMRFAPFADKLAVRDYVTETVGDDILVDLFWHGAPEDIPWDDLPDTYVLKCNHDSRSTRIIHPGAPANRDELTRFFQERVAKTWGVTSLEPWYAAIDAEVMAERYILDDPARPENALHFWCFAGRILTIHDFQLDEGPRKLSIYDEDWQPLPSDLMYAYPAMGTGPRPPDLERMCDIARRLSKPFDFVRVDLYNPHPGEIYFAELTFSPSAGLGLFKPRWFDFYYGSAWDYATELL